jgi:hypothetical protein
MKIVIRVAALALIAVAAVAGNSLPRASNAKMTLGPTGPVPACNPFTRNCPYIR